jgi:hypothetical protein
VILSHGSVSGGRFITPKALANTFGVIGFNMASLPSVAASRQRWAEIRERLPRKNSFVLRFLITVPRNWGRWNGAPNNINQY